MVVITSAVMVMSMDASGHADIINDLTIDFPLGDGGAPDESAARFEEGLSVTLPGNAQVGGDDGPHATSKHPGASTFSETEPSLAVSPGAGGEGIAD